MSGLVQTSSRERYGKPLHGLARLLLVPFQSLYYFSTPVAEGGSCHDAKGKSRVGGVCMRYQSAKLFNPNVNESFSIAATSDFANAVLVSTRRR